MKTTPKTRKLNNKKPFKYRQGGGWVVTWYNEHHKIWMTSLEVGYWQAIWVLRKLRGEVR